LSKLIKKVDMKLSAKTRYGIQALIVLARTFPDQQPVRVQNLARECSAPEKYLVQIFQDLRRAGLVEGVRGNGGGYRLTREPDSIPLREILALLEGPLVTTKDPSGTNLSRVLDPVWRKVDAAVDEVLAEVSLGGLAERWSRAQGPMYYI
jgi:Rrf2 family iron-sulfur cluster assembly transcriptional regulator